MPTWICLYVTWGCNQKYKRKWTLDLHCVCMHLHAGWEREELYTALKAEFPQRYACVRAHVCQCEENKLVFHADFIQRQGVEQAEETWQGKSCSCRSVSLHCSALYPSAKETSSLHTPPLLCLHFSSQFTHGQSFLCLGSKRGNVELGPGICRSFRYYRWFMWQSC